jgi:dihydroxy-acid dehydratase
MAEFVLDMLCTSRRNAVRASSRAFSSCSSIRDENPVLNKYSRIVTQPKDQGASQAMLYATDGIRSDDDFNKAMVGVASVWRVISLIIPRRG